MLHGGFDGVRAFLDAAADGPAPALPRGVANDQAGVRGLVAALAALLAAGMPTAVGHPA